MLDKQLIGKLLNMLILETEQDGEIKTLFLPKGVIVEIKISTDFDHYVDDDSLEEISRYIDDHGLEIKKIYTP